MHILTKFLVVIATVLTVLLSGLTITFESNAQRLRDAIGEERARADAAEARGQSALAAVAAEREQLREELAARDSTITQLRDRTSSLEGGVARLTAEKQRLELNQSEYDTRISEFTALLDQESEINMESARELRELRDKELANARREIELTDRINDLESQLEVSEETVRALGEQLAEVRMQADTRAGVAAAGGPGVVAAGDGEPTILRAPLGVRARITGVSRDVDGALLVSINAGTSDDLAERMRLNIVRRAGEDAGFLASLVLTRVDRNEAVGRVDFLGRQGVDVQAGDLVLSPAG